MCYFLLPVTLQHLQWYGNCKCHALIVPKSFNIFSPACPVEMGRIVPESSRLNFTEDFGRATKTRPNTLEKEVSNMTLLSRLKEGGERFLLAELTPPDQ